MKLKSILLAVLFAGTGLAWGQETPETMPEVAPDEQMEVVAPESDNSKKEALRLKTKEDKARMRGQKQKYKEEKKRLKEQKKLMREQKLRMKEQKKLLKQERERQRDSKRREKTLKKEDA